MNMRERFEAWEKSNGWNDDDLRRNDDGTYRLIDMVIEYGAWQTAWTAAAQECARACVDGYCSAPDDCAAACNRIAEGE